MHAGHAETAMMLALAPETVHMERAVANYPPEFPSKLLSADGRPACAWAARDFGPSGVIGDPAAGHARAGRGDPRVARHRLGPGHHRAAPAALAGRAPKPPGAARSTPATSSRACRDGRPPPSSPSGATAMNRPSTSGPGGALARVAAAGLLAATAVAVCQPAHAEEKFVFLTNWFAEAEHGGFIPGHRHRHLQEGRPRRDGEDGRPAGQRDPADGGRPGRLRDGLERPADGADARRAAVPGRHRGRRCSRRIRRRSSPTTT